ncbi:hypothetical protein FRC12_011241 [Ceratobasidium sp. 428]|nr:hypothetical protein FRC12_011241 [Ceratobasidium sp. 428]
MQAHQAYRGKMYSRLLLTRQTTKYTRTHAQLVQYDTARLPSEENRRCTFSGSSHATAICSLETAQLDGGTRAEHPREYESTTYSVSAHPIHPNLVITADEEGLVRLHDFRSPGAGASPSMEGVLVRNSEINDAQWCPAIGAAHSFVVAQADGNVCLMDSRMAFSTSINPVEDPKNVVQRVRSANRLFSLSFSPDAS